MKKKNWLTILILGGTIFLAVIAVVTAVKLYQLRQEPIAPTAPKPAPAVEPTATPTPLPAEPTPVPACILSFTISGPTPTPTPTGTPGPTSTPTPGPTNTPTPGPTSTPVPGATATPTQITLPEAGITLPTWLTALAGSGLLILGLLFAL